MNATRKKRLSKFGFILGAFLFLLSGINAISEGQYVFAAIQILAAILNIGMLFQFNNARKRQIGEMLIFLLNSIIALVIAIQYIQSGTQGIQYVWLVTALLYLVVMLIKKRKTSSSNA